MSSVVDSLAGYTMTACKTSEELDLAAEFRHRMFRQRSGLAFNEDYERERDASAILVGLLYFENKPVATARSTPFPATGSPLAANGILSFGADSEVGRLAAMPGDRSLINAFLVLILGSLWMTEYTEYATYISYTNAKLVPIYNEVGAFDTGQTCTVPGRTTDYRIVVGAYKDCARLGLKSLGISHRAAMEIFHA